ncbi:MAG: phosphodiester glycosidase family protein [Ruminococcaceae bacterium]|nr:phosphodiester glycosidase family protein [Oscillospiraceae bacterium]
MIKRRKNRTMSVKSEIVLMIISDLLLLAVLLNGFALFHHVLPRSLIHEGMTIVRPADTYPKDENGMWGEKFSDKFLPEGETKRTESSYISHDINVTLEKVKRGSATYYVADIYIRNIDNFKTAFANDTYGKSITESIQDTASRHNAVIATNGDYYGIRDYGICIKNGVLYRRSSFADVCVLYYDGTVKTYKRSEFSLADAISNGAYQAWSFGPELLDDGETVSEFDWSIQSENPRCAFGYYEPGHYCLILIDGRQPGYSMGMTFQEMSFMFKEMGCTAAYNMDGGQSAKMVFGDKLVNRPTKGGRDTSDIIFIAETEDTKR